MMLCVRTRGQKTVTNGSIGASELSHCIKCVYTNRRRCGEGRHIVQYIRKQCVDGHNLCLSHARSLSIMLIFITHSVQMDSLPAVFVSRRETKCSGQKCYELWTLRVERCSAVSVIQKLRIRAGELINHGVVIYTKNTHTSPNVISRLGERGVIAQSPNTVGDFGEWLFMCTNQSLKREVWRKLWLVASVPECWW